MPRWSVASYAAGMLQPRVPHAARDVCEVALRRLSDPDAAAAMVAVTETRARREADESDGRWCRGAPRSSLDGVPVVWKDLYDLAGTVTTCGSELLRRGPAQSTDSALVRRLGDLGMVSLGKTNLSEFAFSGLGVNERFGTPVNPREPARVPGGSSSGSAVAVAAGAVRFAIGTDTSGSVRVPAAFTGCVGYRASRHRYGRHDFRSLSTTLDSVGVLARTVADIRRLDRLLVPGEAGAPVSSVVVAAGEWLDDCTAGVRDTFDAVVARLRRSGVEVVERPVVSLDRAQHLMDMHGTIVGAEAYAAFGHLTGLQPATRRRLRQSAEVTAAPLVRAMPLLRSMFREELDGALLLCPTVRHEAPYLADVLADERCFDEANASTLRTTMALSYLGACGVSLPVADSGLLLSAPEGQDAALLATAVSWRTAEPCGFRGA